MLRCQSKPPHDYYGSDDEPDGVDENAAKLAKATDKTKSKPRKRSAKAL